MIYAIMWFITFFSMSSISQRTIKHAIALCIVFTFWFMAAFKGAGVDPDYQNYTDYIQEVLSYGYSSRGGILFDYLVKILSFIGIPAVAIFVLYSLSIPLKFALFRKFPDITYAILIGYVGFFIYLHDFTQVRAGLAIAIAYWAVYYWFVSQKKIFSFILLLLSCCIHSSLLVVLLFVFLEQFITRNKLLIILFISVIVCAFDGLSSIINKIIELIGNNDLSLYYRLSIDGQIIKPFGLFPVFNLLLSVFCCCILNGMCRQSKVIDVLMKMLILSQITWFLFYPIPVLSARVSQIFLFSIIFILPLVSRITMKNRYILPAFYSLIGFVAFNTVAELMKPYHLIFF